MRLINTETGEFENFVDLSTAPPYAVLSHTWNPPPIGEQSYQDVLKIQEKYRLPPHTPSTPSLRLPLLSSLMFKLLRSLLLSILAGEFLWVLLLGSSCPSARPGSHSEVRAPTPISLDPSIWGRNSSLSDKVRKACEVARRDGYRYIWVDSSCIDKTSSSELSEAINSMFAWYRGAQVCYAFLADVPSDEDVQAEVTEFRERPRAPFFAQDYRERAKSSKFRNSRWFKRAWTLQELIAPRVVVFLSQNWEPIGTKGPLADLVEDITHIDRDILTHKKALADESVAERMRWAAEREATRIEDEAYSLLGIFGITMPTLYGEGRYAFQRLQEEILQRIPDQSLFAWGSGSEHITISTRLPMPDREHPEIDTLHIEKTRGSPFAPSPQSFKFSKGKIVRASGHNFETLQLPVYEYTLTPYGIRTKLYLLPWHAVTGSTLQYRIDSNDTLYLAILGCQASRERGRLLGKLCYVGHGGEYTIDSLLYALLVPTSQDDPYHPLLPVSLEDLIRAKTSTLLETRTVYLPRPETLTPQRRLNLSDNPGALELSLSVWAQADLQLHGYTISRDLCQTENPLFSRSFTLLNATFRTYFQYRYILNCAVMAIEARVWILPHDSEDDSEEVQIDTVQHTPPYTSAVWDDKQPWAISLPPRSIQLIARSGEQLTLQLGLGIVARSHYRIHVDVTTDDGSAAYDSFSTRAVSRDLRGAIYKQHTDVRLTVLGSAQQRLERRGYSIHLEGSGGGSHSLSLCNTDSGFTISIKYFHILRRRPRAERIQVESPGQELVVAARVTLESVPSDRHQRPWNDGPYVVVWADYIEGERGWDWSQPQRGVRLTTPIGDSLTLRLGLELAWESEYYLLVDIERDQGSSLRGELQPDGRHERGEHYMLREPHINIALTLPGHVEHALREQGYHDVHFTRANEDHFLLTLSAGNLTICIEYSHHPFTSGQWNAGDKQQIKLRACTKVSQSSQYDARRRADEHDGWWHVMEWDTCKGGEWQLVPDRWSANLDWSLPSKDVKLTTPTGRELTLRLGFYLVWLGEYCLTVEVVTQPSLSRPESPKTLGTSLSGTNDVEEIDDDGGRQRMITEETDDLDYGAHSGDLALEASPFSRGVTSLSQRRKCRGVGSKRGSRVADDAARERSVL